MPNYDIVDNYKDLLIQPASELFTRAQKTSRYLRPLVIEIGSNGVRIVTPSGESEREPLRLASYVFDDGDDTIRKPINKKGFDALADVIKIALQRTKASGSSHVCCVATSALRETPNREFILEKIYKKTGILIQCISGDLEARLIARAVLLSTPEEKSFFVVDVGGGSLEIIAIKNRKVKKHFSAPLGSVTLKELTTRQISKRLKDKMFTKVESLLSDSFGDGEIPKIAYVTGGNPKDLIKLVTDGKNERDRVSLKELAAYLPTLAKKSRSQLLALGLRTDRVDVIVNASHALIDTLKKLGADEVRAPNTGLQSGIYDCAFGSLPNRDRFLNQSRLKAELLYLQQQLGFEVYNFASSKKAISESLGNRIKNIHSRTFRPYALIYASTFLRDIGYAVMTRGKHPIRGAELLEKLGICSLSRKENIVLSWLVRHHEVESDTKEKIQTPSEAKLTKKEALLVMRLLKALQESQKLARST